MKTKERIIHQAIATYNAKGVSNVTSRDLAKELNMSHGNLEYHFPNKEAILLAIYKQMREEISIAYEVEETKQDPFEAFNLLLNSLETFQEKFLFFNLDFLEISRKHQKIGALLNQTTLLRRQQLSDLFKEFRRVGYINENLDEESYACLVHSVIVLITFWKKQQAIFPSDDSNSQSLAQHTWTLLSSYMTPKGRKVYQDINIPAHV